MNLFHPVKKWSALLISTALLGTLAADATAASDGKPILYGRIHVSLDKLDNEGAGPASATGNSVNAKDRWELNTNASRLGVKGELDLGDTGLTAIYLAEYEIDADDGATPFSQRNIYAGLQSRFGSITAGKNYTPFKQAEGKVDQFNDLAADIDALAGGQNRINNVITYRSPAWAGVTVNAAFSPGENADTDADGKTDLLSRRFYRTCLN